MIIKHMNRYNRGILDARNGGGVPVNPAAPGQTDAVPAMLDEGEAVIPAESAQDPANKPAIDALIQQGRNRQMMARTSTSPEAKQYIQGVQMHLRNYENELKGMNMGGYVAHYNVGTASAGIEERMKRLQGLLVDPTVPEDVKNQARTELNQIAQQMQQQQQGHNITPPQPQQKSWLDALKGGAGNALTGRNQQFTDQLAQIAALQGDTGIGGYQQVTQQQQARDIAAQEAANPTSTATSDWGKKWNDLKAQVEEGVLKPEQAKEAYLQEISGGAGERAKLSERRVDRYIAEGDEAREQATEFNFLLDDIDELEDSELQEGLTGKGIDFFKSLTGSEDRNSVIRTRIQQSLNAAVMNSLPPGVASDKDIALAKEGVPKKFADRDALKDWAELAQLMSQHNSIKAYFKSDNPGLKGKALDDAFHQTEEYKAWERAYKDARSGSDSELGIAGDDGVIDWNDFGG